MTPQERNAKIESYGRALDELDAALTEFPPEMWQFRDECGCWSIHEHIVHMADSEANSYIRCRRLIAEAGRQLMDYDENQWATALDYHRISPQAAVELLRCLRRQTYDLIRSLPESAWANTGYHPENGDMTLEDWLEVYERHIAEHIGYMRENYVAWIAGQSGG